MAFKLSSVVPWGRNFYEYKLMFALDDNDLKKKIAGFGDGPASFNYEASKLGYDIISFDPIYQFSAAELRKRIEEVRSIVMQHIKSLDELENVRMSAMRLFLDDFGNGRLEGRYIYHQLPEKLPYETHAFDIGLSSHFLLMYTSLGYDFHIQAMTEMLRVCDEIRIFPIVDLDANKTELISDVIKYFDRNYDIEIKQTEYEFQKGDNKLLIIKNRI